MIINNSIGNIYVNKSFCSNKQNVCCIDIFNPLDNCYYSHVDRFDLNKPKTFIMGQMSSGETFNAEYNPDLNGELIDKTTNKKFPVNILTCTTDKEPGNIIYQFMSKDLNRNYGYVWFTTPERKGGVPKILAKDYAEEQIIGDRLIVEYLKNFDDVNIGGVGRLADKLEVKYCLDNNIPLNIVSQAKTGSHIAHFKRGKRFISPEVGTVDYNHLMLRYNNSNPNEVLENIINNSDIETSNIDLGYITMYLPKEICEKYANELRQPQKK